MANGSDPASKRPRGAAQDALLEAARQEFEDVGFEHTNTNAIARRAGYAPQTFYRHFPDKLAIFLAVYANWVRQEGVVAAPDQSTERLALQIVQHHRRYRVFRRSLRALTVTDARVAEARAASRHRQVAAISRRNPAFAARPLARQIADLLTVERICDAVADDEFAHLGLSDSDALEQVRIAIVRLLEA